MRWPWLVLGFRVRSAPWVHRQRAVVDHRCFCSASGFGKGAEGGVVTFVTNACGRPRLVTKGRQTFSSEIAQVLRFRGDWVCGGKTLLIVGHFPSCVKSHVPLPMIWPVSICRTFQGKVRDNQLCVFALHIQSPVKRRTSTISEESWPAFRCRCTMWGDKSLTARKRTASFPLRFTG